MMTNVEEARRALTEKPLKATSINRIRVLNALRDKYSHLPQPLRFAGVMRDFLSEIDIPLEKGDIIAGRYVDKATDDEEEKLYEKFIRDGGNVYKTTLFETGHCTLDWEDLVKSGLTGLKARALKSLKAHAGDRDACDFLKGAIGFYDALIGFIRRYAEKADKTGMHEVADVLRAISQRAPDSFYEALQLCWMVAFIDCAYITANPTLSVGRLDVILYPLYLKDKRRGVSDERIKEIIVDYYCKHNLIMGRGEHQLGDESNTTGWDRILNFDAPQYLHIAGTDADGKPAVNRLTELFAECICPGLKNPVTVVRYYKGMAQDHPRLWKTLMEKSLKSCSLMFYNDNDVIEALMRMGVPEADAREYEHFGCNWASLGKNSCWMASSPRSKHFSPELSDEEKKEFAINYHRSNLPNGWVDDFIKAVRKLTESGAQPDSIEAVYDGFFDRMSAFFDYKLDNLKRELDARCKHPSAIITYGDCFRVPPIEQGAANNASAAKWHFEIQTLMCFASVADNFTVVDKLVYRDGKYTLKQLLEAIDADYVGYDEIFAAAKAVPKFGSDDSLSNYHAAKLLTRYTDLVRDKTLPYAEKYRIALMPSVQSDTRNIVMGAGCGASFDARKAGEPFSQNSRPSFGACTSGFTGMLMSLLALPMNRLASGSLNVDIQPKDYPGEEGVKMLGRIAAAYFDNGGLHMQISCLSVDELKDAQLHPERHRDLMVRVTGYSGVFVDMGRDVQNYIIERMQQ